MLRWSLARSIRMGIFSKRVFTKEMTKASTRKSTFTRKSKLLIDPETQEYQDLIRLQSMRSRSTQNINASSSESDSDGDTSNETEVWRNNNNVSDSNLFGHEEKKSSENINKTNPI